MMIRWLSTEPERARSGDGEALTAFAATGIDDRTATTGSHAGTEANFTDPLFAVWSEGGLHLS
jgi:hypothetical protein